MKKIFLLLLVVSLASPLGLAQAQKIATDSLRIAELDAFWTEASRTVREGDFEGYKAAYHEDAVVIFATSFSS